MSSAKRVRVACGDKDFGDLKVMYEDFPLDLRLIMREYFSPPTLARAVAWDDDIGRDHIRNFPDLLGETTCYKQIYANSRLRIPATQVVKDAMYFCLATGRVKSVWTLLNTYTWEQADFDPTWISAVMLPQSPFINLTWAVLPGKWQGLHEQCAEIQVWNVTKALRVLEHMFILFDLDSLQQKDARDKLYAHAALLHNQLRTIRTPHVEYVAWLIFYIL